MPKDIPPAPSVRSAAYAALRSAFERANPTIAVDQRGYVASIEDNLLPVVRIEDIEADLRQGSGNELAGNVRAVHSSSALAVNSFAPFKRQPSDLALLGRAGLGPVRFEKQLRTGLIGTPPNIDVMAEAEEAGVVAIESKLTEYLSPTTASFSKQWVERMRGEWRQKRWFLEMLRLIEKPRLYIHLDAAQLIKHAFGLGLDPCFRDRPATLLYLYWEPLNADDHPIFAAHKREIEMFAERVAGSFPHFAAVSYLELWRGWKAGAPAWLAEHLAHLERRYTVNI